MKPNIKSKLDEFASIVVDSADVPSSKVVEFLDVIADELDLSQVYVCENSAAENHYLYPYVSSKGPKALTMHKNLIVLPDSDTDRMLSMFEESPIIVFDGLMSASRNATAKNNLAYGYIVNKCCIGFVSFQPNDENHIWTDEEKETIEKVALAIKPLITVRQIFDRFAYEKNLKHSSLGVIWYYPILNVLIVNEATMKKYGISNFVYHNAPASFIEDFVSKEYEKDVIEAFETISDDNPNNYVVFERKDSINHFYRLALNVNRSDDKGKPEEVMCLIEEINKFELEQEENSDVYNQYLSFRETISRSNVIEYYVNLINGKITTFKADAPYGNLFSVCKDFDTLIEKFSQAFVSNEHKVNFLKIMNSDYLQDNLNKHNRYITFITNCNFDGIETCLETTIVMYNRTINNLTKDVMIFVRDVTNVESLNYDRLTGLYSMSYFINRFVELKDNDESQQNDNKGCIIYFNFVQFKLYNLEYGLKSGDTILKQFSEVLRLKFPGALLSRFGDDHFVVYDSSNDGKEIQKINEVFDVVFGYEKQSKLVLKAGIYYVNSTSDYELAVDYAQLACHDIKNDVKSNYKVYDDALKEKINKRKYIMDSIDNALEKGWIKIFYQPVISTVTNKLCSMEALSRWVDPKYGFLSPADFIPVLEESNQIYKLDMFVINHICENIKNELNKGNIVVPVSFNVSRNDFISCKPFEEIEKCIKKYNVDRKYICIEITESVMMEEPLLIHSALDQFRNAGYQVWMDDFGSGYSSLNVLKDFYFDEIKIDMAFLRNFDEKSKTIVRYIISMANKLNIGTLCEGVENKEHIDFLKEAKCGKLQGYFYSKPLPYDELMKIMKEKNLL